MPLARIITDSVDESLELTMQLRSRGFQVETVAPGDVPSTPADLEVRLEECNSEDVLTQTAQVSDADDLWVFVAPGALDESVRPIRTIPVVAPVIRIPEAKPPESKSQVAPAVVRFAVPEDDPILLELPAAVPAAVTPAARVVPKNGTSHRSAELLRQSTEVVQFPASRSMGGEVASGLSVRSHEPAPISAADLRFWRIASVTAALAIAFLLLGVNLSRVPGPAKNGPQAAVTVTEAFGEAHPTTNVISSTAEPPIPAPPKPAAGKTGRPRLSRPPIELASKTVRLRKAGSRRPARHSSDDVIATDTVIYFDRKGHPSVQKP